MVGPAGAAYTGSGKTSSSTVHLESVKPRSPGSMRKRFYAGTPATRARPARTCEQCVDFEQLGGHPSYTELNCARFGRFEDVEEELKNLKFHPMFGRWRFLVLDEAHQMSLKAFDALLKHLEETPP